MKKIFEKVLNFAWSIPKTLAFLWILLSYMLATKFFVHQFFPPLSFFPYIYMRIAPYYVYHPYYATSIWIWVLAIIVCIVLFVLILKNKNVLQKWKYAFIALMVWLLSHILFFICTPQYVYNFHPQWLMYKSLDGKYIVNKDIYFYFVKKYGLNSVDTIRFKTIKDATDALELAKIIKNKELYYSVFRNLGNLGYDKILENYNDKTFQWYFLKSLLYTNVYEDKSLNFFYNNLKNLDLLNIALNDTNISSIAKWLKIDCLYVEWLSKDDLYKYMKNMQNKYLYLLNQIDWEKNDIFYY